MVPEEFIQHIVSLGFNENDAPRLYEEKDNWMGISTDGKVSCVVRGCKFETPITSDGLFEHCRSRHQWKDYPCQAENCNFVAYCSMSLKKHTPFHSRPPSTQHQFTCSKKNCQWTFSDRSGLRAHENTHDNISLKCIYCPYRCVKSVHMTMHQREHFNIRDFKCHICKKAFKQVCELNIHFTNSHSGFVTNCFICDYNGSVSNVREHLRQKHKVLGYRWDAKNSKFVKM